jgi:hypothetical protein
VVLVTVPFPTLLTVRVYGLRVNKAVTDFTAVILTTQLPVPEQPPPLQPLKIESGAGFVVRVTFVLKGKSYEQVVPQSMPAGVLVTVPDPVLPTLLTVSVWVDGMLVFNKMDIVDPIVPLVP